MYPPFASRLMLCYAVFPMHVLALPSWYPTAERPHNGVYFREQLQALHHRGVQVGVVYPEARSLRRLSTMSAHTSFQTHWYDEAGLPTLRRHGWNLFWRLPQRHDRRIRQALRLAHRYVKHRGRPDLLHALSARWAGAAAVRLGQAYDLPVVVTEHFSGFARGTVKSRQRRLVREAFRGACRVAAVSSALRDTLVRQGLVAKDRVLILSNMVDTRFFHPPAHRPPPPPFRFFALAELVSRKGLDVLLDAFTHAFSRQHDVRLEIGGDGPQRTALARQADRLGLGPQVRFLGRLSREGVRAAFWRAHAFVHPSHRETFGVALLEALATGLPVVATACGGPEDFVTPDVGLLVTPGDPHALASGLTQIVEDGQAFHPSSIYAYVRECFSEERWVTRHLALYQDVLGKCAGG